ncbi:MAG: DUF1272 domain-containing protein [Alphaproteobacteria bacterium]
MKENCEHCKGKLAQDGPAYICSYECTYCAPCAADLMARCPNCGGELLSRPRRQKS